MKTSLNEKEKQAIRALFKKKTIPDACEALEIPHVELYLNVGRLERKQGLDFSNKKGIRGAIEVLVEYEHEWTQNLRNWANK